MPEATLLTSAFNSRPFIDHKVQNFLEAREHADVEMVIIDCNGGREVAAISRERREHEAVRIKVFNERISIWRAVNEAIALAESPYVVQANTDDLVHPTAYRRQIDLLNDGCDISYFDYRLQYGYIAPYEKAAAAWYDYYKAPPEGYSSGRGLGPFPMWKKSLHERFGKFDEGLEIYSDSLFWDALSKDPDIRWGHIPEFLGVYANRGGDNLENNEEFGRKDRDLLKRRLG